MTRQLDPQMSAAKQRQDDVAATLPPATIETDLAQSRRNSDALAALWSEGGPEMAQTEEFWLFAQGRRVQCRLHRPIADATLPVLIWFHGGGWVHASIDSHDRLAREYAAAGRVAVLLVDYALAPEARFPRAVLEGADIVRAVAEQAPRLRLAADKIVLGGDSAGGNLAFAVALHVRETASPPLAGILAAYPVTDAACDTESYHAFAEGFGLTRAGMMMFWNAYLSHEADRLNPLASPLRAALHGLPPCLLQMAELDVLRDDGLLMAERLREAGVDVTVEVIPGVLHGFLRLSGAVDAASQTIGRAGAWLGGLTG